MYLARPPLQDEAYRNSVLPPEVTARVSVEAGSTFGWEKWVGSKGKSIGINEFGASAPGPLLYEKVSWPQHLQQAGTCSPSGPV